MTQLTNADQIVPAKSRLLSPSRAETKETSKKSPGYPGDFR